LSAIPLCSSSFPACCVVLRDLHSFPTRRSSDLTIRFGGVTALDAVSALFTAPVAGIIGPNGAGKTTTMNVVSGFHRRGLARAIGDRKSTRLNSSHVKISYAVFCLKKKNDTDRPG